VRGDAGVLLVLPFLLLIPAIVVFLLSRASGWSTLADAYPLLGAFPATRTWLGYGVFRGWIGYNGCLILGSDQTGLYLRTWPLLSIFHAPVFIPWSEIREIDPPSGWLGAANRLHTVRAPDLDFALRPSTFELVREDARRAGVPGRY
jgi:hypothetical protein